MASFRIRRKAATPKGFLRRIADAGFGQLADARQQAWVVHPLGAVLGLAVLGIASGARSNRAVEDRSEQLRPKVRAELGLRERISDNAFAQIISGLHPLDVRPALHRHVKKERRRKRLEPTRLPWNTVAVDGKGLATLDERRLRALLRQRTGLDTSEMGVEQLRSLLRTQFPYVQLQDGNKRLVGLLRVHRATLISSQAAVVIDQWPIKGRTNEQGTIQASLRALLSAYEKTTMVEMVTLDAGNTSIGVAKLLRAHSVDYFMSLKSSQGRMHQLAVDTLEKRDGSQAELCRTHDEKGKTVCYSVWTHRLDDNLGWAGARQLVRIERVVAGDDGEPQVGNRYFVTSKGDEELNAEHALLLARGHWRCENEGHWTADAIFDEDARRTPWTQHPNGVLVVGILRAIAINILAVLRALSRDAKGRKPSWKTLIEQALIVLCDPLLDMEAFNAFEE